MVDGATLYTADGQHGILVKLLEVVVQCKVERNEVRGSGMPLSLHLPLPQTQATGQVKHEQREAAYLIGDDSRVSGGFSSLTLVMHHRQDAMLALGLPFSFCRPCFLAFSQFSQCVCVRLSRRRRYGREEGSIRGIELGSAWTLVMLWIRVRENGGRRTGTVEGAFGQSNQWPAVTIDASNS